MASRKQKHGGRRPGAGRPQTIAGGGTDRIVFRLSPADRQRGEAVAAAESISVGELARRAYLDRIERKGG